MEEILQTTLLEIEKSAFIIDLAKHTNGKHFVRILQTISTENTKTSREIKINPALLSELILVLENYNEMIPGFEKERKTRVATDGSSKVVSKIKERRLTENQKHEIINRYLRGISIIDLTMQFDCKSELILQVLYNNNIPVVDNQPPKPNSRRSWYKKKK